MCLNSYLVSLKNKENMLLQDDAAKMGHISRFIPPGSVRIGLDTGSNPVQAVAFKRPDNAIAVVLLNR